VHDSGIAFSPNNPIAILFTARRLISLHPGWLHGRFGRLAIYMFGVTSFRCPFVQYAYNVLQWP